MPQNRRTWLKQIGWGMAGLGVVPLESFAADTTLPDVLMQDGITRLSSNENPYGPALSAINAMAAAAKLSNRYTWQLSTDLINAIAAKHQLNAGNVLTSAGSTVILDLQARYFGAGKGSFVISDITFSFWTKLAVAAGYNKISVPLTADKKQDLPALLSAIRPDTNMVYLCNPNNPTGTIIPDDELSAFITEASKKVTVVIDEAYLDYTDQPSASRWVTNNKNLIIIKTFSKIYGMAGGRIGYALGHEETMEKLDALQTWSNGDISVASRAGAIASLKDEAFVQKCKKQNAEVKKETIQQLEKLSIRCIPSHTNFIYFSLQDYKKDFFELLKQNQVQGTGIYEEAGKWTRITVGTKEEMQKFLQVIS